MDMALHKPRDCTGCMQSVDWTTLLKWGVTVIPTLGVLVHFNSDGCALNTLRLRVTVRPRTGILHSQ